MALWLRGRVVPLGSVALLFVLACGAGEGAAPADAKVIEGRLLAPCCWTQTLDVHDSPVASALRDEIEARAAAGQAADRIEGDLADRFGERIRVVPPGRDPRGLLAGAVFIASVAALVAMALVIRKWVRSTRAPSKLGVDAMPPALADDYDRKLDDELARLGPL